MRPCDGREVINIFDVLLHVFKNLDKVAVNRLIIFPDTDNTLYP